MEASTRRGKTKVILVFLLLDWKYTRLACVPPTPHWPPMSAVPESHSQKDVSTRTVLTSPGLQRQLGRPQDCPHLGPYCLFLLPPSHSAICLLGLVMPSWSFQHRWAWPTLIGVCSIPPRQYVQPDLTSCWFNPSCLTIPLLNWAVDSLLMWKKIQLQPTSPAYFPTWALSVKQPDPRTDPWMSHAMHTPNFVSQKSPSCKMDPIQGSAHQRLNSENVIQEKYAVRLN